MTFFFDPPQPPHLKFSPPQTLRLHNDHLTHDRSAIARFAKLMTRYIGCLCLLVVLAFAGACIAADNVDKTCTDASILPWHIDVPQAQLNDLKHRLEHAILPTELEDVDDWSYGTPKSFMQYMVKFWIENYNWRDRETILNSKFGSSNIQSVPAAQESLPSGQYMASINGSKIHFLHYVSSNASATPLIMVHGWPGSVLECVNMVPHLQSRFHIVCPSIPGYFYSEAPTKKGMDTEQIAKQFAVLMKMLHYGRYVASGGDWGAEVARWIGISDMNCVGVHMNMVIAQVPLSTWADGVWELLTSVRASLELLLPTWFFDTTEIQHFERMKQYALKGSGYLIQHSTSPQTNSFAFSDSPIGLASYIWEKYQLWTDLPTESPESNVGKASSKSVPPSDPRKRWPILQVHSEEFLIDTVMFYWLPNSIASSMRLYKETVPKLLSEALPYQFKPTVISAFKDIVIMPKSWARNYLNIVEWRDHAEGGHWPSLEAPQVLSLDIISLANNVTDLLKEGFAFPKQPTDILGFSSTEL